MTHIVSIGSLVKQGKLDTHVHNIPFVPDHNPITWDGVLRQVSKFDAGRSGTVIGTFGGLTDSRVESVVAAVDCDSAVVLVGVGRVGVIGCDEWVQRVPGLNRESALSLSPSYEEDMSKSARLDLQHQRHLGGCEVRSQSQSWMRMPMGLGLSGRKPG